MLYRGGVWKHRENSIGKKFTLKGRFILMAKGRLQGPLPFFYTPYLSNLSLSLIVLQAF